MIHYRKLKKEEVKDIARMCALTFAEYPICNDIKKEIREYGRYIAFMSEVYEVHIRAHYKSSVFFVGEEGGKIRSFAVLVRPYSSNTNLMDYICSDGLKLMKMVSLPKLLKFLNVLEEGHKPISGMKDHSWLLELLAVDRSYTGRQLGSKMINECIIPYIKEQSMGAEPETFITFTNTELNKKFYLKNGFTEFDYKTIQMDKNAIGNWSFRMSINPSL
ncbi:GNAT family N-acetyltransferase [Clostridium sp. E02]|uniref:GNAT family N-acetyltransferase n=1 Tax=Clostridium sp. E02 TaxID=2487134 RepID=UPI000F528C23|nr:GNAT family N-acetyltransferase [Clostridium sp. E02]